jgi:hypothetical protein
MTTDVATVSNDLFSGVLSYDGRGRAEFLDPSGAVEGPVSVRFDEFGEASIEMTVDQIETDQPLQLGLMELFSGAKPVRTEGAVSIGIGGLQNPCIKLTVDSTKGTFIATEGLHYGFGLHLGDGGKHPTKLSFHPLRAQFNASGAGKANYWVMPLSNFVSRFTGYHPTLDTHPLHIRYSATPDQGNNSSPMSTAITFEFGDALGFIQPLTDYDLRASQLEKGSERHWVTALMVGEVGSCSIESDDLEDWFPFDFLRLLSFATGTTVGSPWIEFRDVSGDLVQRIHRNMELEPFSRGRRIIEEVIHSGVGYLLTRYQTCPDRGAAFLRVALRHIIQGGSYSGSVEDTTVYLCRALDGLCERYGFKTQYLLAELDQNRQQEISEILDTAKGQIRAAARKASWEGSPEQSRVMERIADRVRSNAANKDVDFGLAVTGLLKHFGLPDADIIDAHYRSNPRPDGIRSWSAVLSHYRGTTMHTGHYDFSGSRHDFGDILRINDHLLDILIRIIFRIVGYDGTYQPPIIKMTDRVPADWVNDTTPAAQLGY